MRNLTIKRNKTFVACLGKMHVYIEDPSSGELTISNVPCRKLGSLKNGEEKTFAIDDTPAKLFVIADKLSKEYCNELYEIPEGNEDIFLSGKNQFNPTVGNAFRFDGVANDNVLDTRSKGQRKGSIVFIVSLFVGIILGVSISLGAILIDLGSEPKDFSSDGMKITLTDEFEKASANGFTVCYSSQDVAVLASKESFSYYPWIEELSINEYGEMLLINSGFDSSVKLTASDGLCYFEYENVNPDTKKNYYYFAVLYKAPDAFWMIQFATLADGSTDLDDYRRDFIEWAKSVEFTK